MEPGVIASSKESVPGTLFCQPWWLDAVVPDAWDEVVLEKNGEFLARMPYAIRRKRGKTKIFMPSLTQTLGPTLRPSKAKRFKRLSEQKKLMTELIEQLPPFDRFQQNFHYSITNWLPFYWKGFHQTTRYTYVLDDLSDPESLFKDFRENIRGDIRKASKQGVVVRDDLGMDAFLELHEATFDRQKMEMPYSQAFVRRLDEACVANDARKMLFAVDASNRIHAAAYIVWDRESAYYLMAGTDPSLRNTGATSLVLWEAIRFAATVTKKFDFEGSMLEPVERYFRAFGGRQMPYFQITKDNPASRIGRLFSGSG
jgi:hypothetical protein